MKGKPVFKNTTKARIQIIQRGIPIWMNPGDTIVGERYRAFLSMGLEEVGREHLPKPSLPKSAPKPVVNDESPDKSPIQVRKIQLTDVVLPHDDLKVGGSTKALDALIDKHLPAAPEPAEEPEAEEEEAEVAPEDRADGPSGETLKAMLIEDLSEEPELAITLDVEADGDDELIVIEEDEPTEEETHPFVCEECGRGFASKRGLKSHSRVHKK